MINVTEEHLIYLDDLRKNGEIPPNMLGASSYVLVKFNLSPRDAKSVSRYWRATFDFRHRKKKQRKL